MPLIFVFPQNAFVNIKEGIILIVLPYHDAICYWLSFFLSLEFCLDLTCLSTSLLLIRRLKGSVKAVTVKGQGIATVQKRPVRPILPAYYNTGEL